MRRIECVPMYPVMCVRESIETEAEAESDAEKEQEPPACSELVRQRQCGTRKHVCESARTFGGAEAAVGEQSVEHLHGCERHGVEAARGAVARRGLEVRARRRRVSAGGGAVGRQRGLQLGLASAGVPNGCVRAVAAIARTRTRILILILVRTRALILPRVRRRRVCARAHAGGRRRLRGGTRVRRGRVRTSRVRCGSGCGCGCGAAGAVRVRARGRCRGRRRRVECARRGARARRAPRATGGGCLQREKVE